LPRDAYRGSVVAAFCARVANHVALFTSDRTVETFTDLLSRAIRAHGCIVRIFCFMPDHLHLILEGNDASADLWKAMVEFKQRSGLWLAHHNHAAKWQTDFHDHIIRTNEDLVAHIRYVANNPVRRGLVEDWDSYRFTGTIGGGDPRSVLESTA
jgi:putative transposase